MKRWRNRNVATVNLAEDTLVCQRRRGRLSLLG